MKLLTMPLSSDSISSYQARDEKNSLQTNDGREKKNGRDCDLAWNGMFLGRTVQNMIAAANA